MIYGFIETKDGNIYEWELHPVFFAKWASWIEYLEDGPTVLGEIS